MKIKSMLSMVLMVAGLMVPKAMAQTLNTTTLQLIPSNPLIINTLFGAKVITSTQKLAVNNAVYTFEFQVGNFLMNKGAIDIELPAQVSVNAAITTTATAQGLYPPTANERFTRSTVSGVTHLTFDRTGKQSSETGEIVRLQIPAFQNPSVPGTYSFTLRILDDSGQVQQQAVVPVEFPVETLDFQVDQMAVTGSTPLVSLNQPSVNEGITLALTLQDDWSLLSFYRLELPEPFLFESGLSQINIPVEYENPNSNPVTFTTDTWQMEISSDRKVGTLKIKGGTNHSGATRFPFQK
ncbi:hypothetical protein IPJ72_04630 [Candidatus Peregrinibacteria bacterium]|nr:MAG: hypothetical protein IPJ72_04630 [Candidatus Peregrinibacteria bacterium]